MKKKIAAISLLAVLLLNTFAFAWLPAAYAVVTYLTYAAPAVTSFILDSYIVHVTLAGAGLAYYAIQNNGKSQVDPNANIKRDANVTWVELGPNNSLPVKQANIKASVTHDALRQNILKDEESKAKYPNLRLALEKPDTVDLRSADPETEIKFLQPGDKVVCHDGVVRNVVSVQFDGPGYYTKKVPTSFTQSSDVPGSNYRSNSTYGTYPAPETRHMYSIKVFYNSNQPAQPQNYTPLTPEQSAQRLAHQLQPIQAPQDVYSDYYGEIDQFIKDNPNVVNFVDSVTGQNAVPSNALTQKQIDAALAAQRAANQSQSAIESANTAATNARTAANNARAAANAAAAAAAANPGDIALAQAAAAAGAAADAAERAADAAETNAQKLVAEQAKEEAEQAKEEAEKEKSENMSIPGIPGDPKNPDLNFDGFNQLKSKLQSTYPFNYLSKITETVSLLTADPVAPSFDLPIYGGNTLHIDLSPFEIVATICRWGVAVLVTVAGVQYVVAWWRGVS